MNPLAGAQWLNPPAVSLIAADGIKIVIHPRTDFWQRTFYGFRAANAPAAMIEIDRNVTRRAVAPTTNDATTRRG